MRLDLSSAFKLLERADEVQRLVLFAYASMANMPGAKPVNVSSTAIRDLQ